MRRILALVLSLFMVAAPVSAQEGATTFDQYVVVVTDCGEALNAAAIEAVQLCLLTLDTLVPSACFVESYSLLRTMIFLLLEGIETQNRALGEAATYLSNEFVANSEETGKACLYPEPLPSEAT
jgi:hypothetical protein